MVNVPSLGCIGFVLWVFERLVGHRIARPGHRSNDISVSDGSGAVRY